MTDDTTLTDTSPDQGESDDESRPAGVEGRAAWPWIKDAGLAIFGLFFLMVYLVIRSVGLDDATGAGTAAGVSSGPIAVTLTEYHIAGSLDEASGNVILNIVNDGTTQHNLVIPDLDVRTDNLQPGEAVTLDLGRVPARSYTVYCDLPGHRQSGMETELKVS